MGIVKNIQRAHEVFYTHINPHDRFEVDLDRRIDSERRAT